MVKTLRMLEPERTIPFIQKVVLLLLERFSICEQAGMAWLLMIHHVLHAYIHMCIHPLAHAMILDLF